MIKIIDTNSLGYDWVNGKVSAVESGDLLVPENANAGAIELAIRTANLHGRTDLLERWKAELTNDDADTITNTYKEMKAFFASVQEGTDFITELNKKANTTDLTNLYGRTDLLERWKAELTNDDADTITNTYKEMKAFFASVQEGTDFITELNKKANSSSSSNSFVGVENDLSGDYKYSARANSHGGWLICQGQTVSRTAYANLFGVIGVSFGVGDGSTTFNLPDAQGRVSIGVGAGAGLTNRTLGSKGGAETHTLTTTEMPTHTHAVNDGTHAHAQYAIANFNTGGIGIRTNYTGEGTGANAYASGISVSSSYTNISIQNAGGGSAHNNMQPFVAIGNLFIHI